MGELGRRFALCETHHACIDPHANEPCEICNLLDHKADLLAACKEAIKQTDDKTIKAFGLGPRVAGILIAAIAKATVGGTS